MTLYSQRYTTHVARTVHCTEGRGLGRRYDKAVNMVCTAESTGAWLQYVLRWIIRPQTVTHPSTNRTRRKATTLIETNAIPLSHTTNQI